MSRETNSRFRRHAAGMPIEEKKAEQPVFVRTEVHEPVAEAPPPAPEPRSSKGVVFAIIVAIALGGLNLLQLFGGPSESELRQEVEALQATVSDYSEKAEFVDNFVAIVIDDGQFLYHHFDCPYTKDRPRWVYNVELAEFHGNLPHSCWFDRE
ncbi:MAG: hypothetical protein FWH32_06525 [Clostridiales bacterium]|nr:hypothetical protein [Clostridiales bacterium]